jgi:hypothetical protein
MADDNSKAAAYSLVQQRAVRVWSRGAFLGTAWSTSHIACALTIGTRQVFTHNRHKAGLHPQHKADLHPRSAQGRSSPQHTPTWTDIDETLSAIDELHRQGKIKEFGLSNYPAWKVVDVRSAGPERSGSELTPTHHSAKPLTLG